MYTIFLNQSFEEKRRFFVDKGVNQDGGGLVVSGIHWLSPFEFVVTYIPQDQTSLQSFVVLLSTQVNSVPYVYLHLVLYNLIRITCTIQTYYT